MPSFVLTLTTDFGTRDAYVAAMKGVILNAHPDARLVDITHDIAPQDIMEAAFVLRQAYPFFPPETVHLVVVDPGVGTQRRAVAVEADGHRFVGPDNGLFPLLLGEVEPEQIVTLDRPAFWRVPTPSRTFHGRDIFAPAAAHLARGEPLATLGTPISNLKPLRWALPLADDEGIRGMIVHIDRFGNCITNIPQTLIARHADTRLVTSYAGSAIIRELQETYGAVDEFEPLALVGSSGYLEIAVNGGNAATLLSIRKGDPVTLVFRRSINTP